MRRLSAGLLLTVLTACASTRVVDTAYHGDRSSLKEEIARARARGDLDASTVREIAQAVLKRTLRSAPPAEAAATIGDLRPCARALSGELRAESRRADEAGAAARLMLLELGELNGESLVRAYARDQRGAFRRLAARGAVDSRHAPLRRSFYVDPDARVRLSAFHAGLIAADAADLEVLLEAARLEPEPLGRSVAARAVGAIGGERAVVALDDLWPRASETERLVLLEAWSVPAALHTGGAQRLVRATESDAGLVRVAAAAALVRSGGEGADLGKEVLVRAVTIGATDERRLAILSVPLQSREIAALERAATAADLEVRVLALARLLEARSKRAWAQPRLGELARADSDVARQARAALAAVGDRAALAPLRRDMTAKNPNVRRTAALALVLLGEEALAADALVDPDGKVRLRVACALLVHRFS